MAKVDKQKNAKLERQRYEMSADQPPSKTTKRAKVKERQAGKKTIKKELRDQ